MQCACSNVPSSSDPGEVGEVGGADAVHMSLSDSVHRHRDADS